MRSSFIYIMYIFIYIYVCVGESDTTMSLLCWYRSSFPNDINHHMGLQWNQPTFSTIFLLLVLCQILVWNTGSGGSVHNVSLVFIWPWLDGDGPGEEGAMEVLIISKVILRTFQCRWEDMCDRELLNNFRFIRATVTSHSLIFWRIFHWDRDSIHESSGGVFDISWILGFCRSFIVHISCQVVYW